MRFYAGGCFRPNGERHREHTQRSTVRPERAMSYCGGDHGAEETRTRCCIFELATRTPALALPSPSPPAGVRRRCFAGAWRCARSSRENVRGDDQPGPSRQGRAPRPSRLHRLARTGTRWSRQRRPVRRRDVGCSLVAAFTARPSKRPTYRTPSRSSRDSATARRRVDRARRGDPAFGAPIERECGKPRRQCPVRHRWLCAFLRERPAQGAWARGRRALERADGGPDSGAWAGRRPLDEMPTRPFGSHRSREYTPV
jgi:hypothetical protein